MTGGRAVDRSIKLIMYPKNNQNCQSAIVHYEMLVSIQQNEHVQERIWLESMLCSV